MKLFRLFGEINARDNYGHAGYFVDAQNCGTYITPSQWLGNTGDYRVAVWDTDRGIPLRFCLDEEGKWGCDSFIRAYFRGDMLSVWEKGMKPNNAGIDQLRWEQIDNVRASYGTAGNDIPIIRLTAPAALGSKFKRRPFQGRHGEVQDRGTTSVKTKVKTKAILYSQN